MRCFFLCNTWSSFSSLLLGSIMYGMIMTEILKNTGLVLWVVLLSSRLEVLFVAFILLCYAFLSLLLLMSFLCVTILVIPWCCFILFADSVISDIQRDHMESIEKLVPDLASLRGRLCPSYMDEDIFWKIYFRLLESNIIEHSSEVYSFFVQHSLVAYIWILMVDRILYTSFSLNETYVVLKLRCHHSIAC